jgi:NAD(P)-dependent dehydrogenase (short-subunit alcohol dehydrogenase family)
MKKVAIITGGTRGIGLGIAKEFLKKGYRVVLNYRSDEEKAKEVLSSLNSEDALCIQADISLQEDRERLLAEVKRHFGFFDVLVNNAAIIKSGRFLEVQPEDFEMVMDTNFYGPLYLSQLFSNALVSEKRSGSIVNINSVGAYGPGNIAYCTSKASLLFLTRCMARELAKHKIRVNSVSPGIVETDLNQLPRDENPEKWNKILSKIPLERAALPGEIAAAVYFLASEGASYITGRDLVVDGGSLG